MPRKATFTRLQANRHKRFPVEIEEQMIRVGKALDSDPNYVIECIVWKVGDSDTVPIDAFLCKQNGVESLDVSVYSKGTKQEKPQQQNLLLQQDLLLEDSSGSTETEDNVQESDSTHKDNVQKPESTNVVEQNEEKSQNSLLAGTQDNGTQPVSPVCIPKQTTHVAESEEESTSSLATESPEPDVYDDDANDDSVQNHVDLDGDAVDAIADAYLDALEAGEIKDNSSADDVGDTDGDDEIDRLADAYLNLEETGSLSDESPKNRANHSLGCANSAPSSIAISNLMSDKMSMSDFMNTLFREWRNMSMDSVQDGKPWGVWVSISELHERSFKRRLTLESFLLYLGVGHNQPASFGCILRLSTASFSRFSGASSLHTINSIQYNAVTFSFPHENVVEHNAVMFKNATPYISKCVQVLKQSRTKSEMTRLRSAEPRGKGTSILSKLTSFLF